ncbi:MAG: CRISPR-associated endoribonuclease Cas6 [Bacteroidota bacterium]
MRLTLLLQHRSGQTLPINYQWLISSWIYRTLEKTNPAFSKWLHDHGFGYGKKRYKLFTFGQLRPRKFAIGQSQTFVLKEGPTRLDLSFAVPDALQHFIIGLFEGQDFYLSSGVFRVDFRVLEVQMKQAPRFQDHMRFRLLTPICVSRRGIHEKYAQYLHPATEGYADILMRNLLHKSHSLQPQPMAVGTEPSPLDFDFHFRPISQVRSKLLRIHGNNIRGYQFDFEASAPPELLRMGYYAGFGERNSNLGMGMVNVLK